MQRYVIADEFGRRVNIPSCGTFAKLKKAGAPLIRATAVHWVTPEDLWKLPWEVVYSSSK